SDGLSPSALPSFCSCFFCFSLCSFGLNHFSRAFQLFSTKFLRFCFFNTFRCFLRIIFRFFVFPRRLLGFGNFGPLWLHTQHIKKLKILPSPFSPQGEIKNTHKLV